MRDAQYTAKLLMWSLMAFVAILLLSNFSLITSTMSKIAEVTSIVDQQSSEGTAEPSASPLGSEAVTPDEGDLAQVPENTESGVSAGAIALYGGIGIGALVLLAGTAYGARAIHRRHRGAAEDRKILLGRWEAAKKRHTDLREKSYPIETDLLARVDYPALFDYADPATEAWVEAADAATALELDEPPLHSEARVNAYEAAVGKADRAWNRAFSNARRVNLSRFTPEERYRVQKARKLLTRVLDAASTEHERRAAYEKAIELLGGLIEVPKKVLVALEERIHVRLAITEGQHTAGADAL